MKINNKIPLTDLKIQYRGIKKDIDTSIKKVITNTNFIMGQEIFDLEKNFARFIGVKYAVGVSSGTDAVHLALYALNIHTGDEVILPSFTFTATAEPIVWLGATPVFVDIDKKTYTVDPEKIKQAITSKTKVIIPVHLYGQPADMNPIMRLAKENGISILEDAAQAHGAIYKSKKAGSFGTVAIFSFYPGKNLGAYGDAGMVVTNNKHLAHKISMLRNHGRTEKYSHEMIGYGDRMDTLQAAILSAKLPHLNAWNRNRRRIAKLYSQNLSGIKQIKLFREEKDCQSVYHLYVIRIKDRDNLKKYLQEMGIETGIHYPIPLHLQPAYKYLGYKIGDLPVTEKIANSVLSLPIYPEMTKNMVNYICKCLKDYYS